MSNYDINARPMPWKGQKDPYSIWLSEIILQQTRVEQGWNYYLKFKQLYPDVMTLANAPLNDILKVWEGLGYYSRARNLHKAANLIKTEYNGKFPFDYKTLLTLPGIGPYTAAAVASFSVGEHVAVLDGNVFRVLSRYYGDSTDTFSSGGKKHFQQIADRLILDVSDPALFNQAIMDLGATVCTPKNPDCFNCPLQESCTAYKLNEQNLYPVKSKSLIKRPRYIHYFLHQKDSGFYITQRGEGDIWALMYELPNQVFHDKELAAEHFENIQDSIYDSKMVKHQLTHLTIHARLFVVKTSESFKPEKNWMLIDPSEMSNFAFHKLIHVLMEQYYKSI